MIITSKQETEIFTISQLNAEVRELLEDNLPLIWIEGEISNLIQPKSGHLYFTLKDEFAQVRCAMFRGRNNRLDFNPEDGMHILAQANVSLYEPRGDYQLIIQHMEPAGEGILRQRFERLKNRLQNEGLFNNEHKQKLPQFPQSIGVITSPTGAAVRDIISVSKRRAPNIQIIIYPAQVQGTKAKNEIAHAIKSANKHNKCDILIVARGGGSLEDLWSFNEEIVARAIFNSKIPIISGVGHETDFTIADFVADYRAPTPSAAAEFACPDQQEIISNINHYQIKLTSQIKNRLNQLKLHLNNLSKRLQHPGKKLQQYTQQLDRLEQSINRGIENNIKQKRIKLINLARNLETLSPLATLNRGFAIVTEEKNNQVIRNAQQVNRGDKIKITLRKGLLKCTVTAFGQPSGSSLDIRHNPSVKS